MAIIAASTALGASATMLTGREPGSILGVFVIIGAVAAAVAVRPQAGYLTLPVPTLSYLVAAIVTGVIYDRSADVSETALAINAAQWIASGFLAMTIATLLAVVLVTVRWIIWRRQRPGSAAPGRPARPGADQGRPQPGLDDYWSPAPYPNPYGPQGWGEQGPQRWGEPGTQGWTEPGTQGWTEPGTQHWSEPGTQGWTEPGTQHWSEPGPQGWTEPGPRHWSEPGPRPAAPGAEGPSPGGPGPGQQWPPRTDPRQERPPGSGPYNFSSGA